jgi:ferric-dicitrate binding protein FerR (iron transport regulator)
MRIQDHIVHSLTFSLGMLERTVADFSDDDLLARPVGNANHAAWQIGHLICSDTRLAQAVATAPELPAGFAEKFTKETAATDTGFPSKAELLQLYRRQREGIIAWVKAASDADLEKATPERLQRLGGSAGALLLFLPLHLTLHTGQIQVIRRALGKPVLM